MATRHDFQLEGEPHTVAVDTIGGRMLVSVDGGEPLEVGGAAAAPTLVSVMRGAEAIPVYLTRQGRNLRVLVEGRAFLVRPGGAGGRARGEGGLVDPPGQILAPLAGVLVDIRITIGGRLVPGEVVMVIEAMKMQNEVQATLAGTVTAINATRGERVEKSDILVEYDPDEG